MNDQPPLVSSVNPPPSKPSKTSGLAVASLVFGILSLTCILPVVGSVLAIVFGIVALNKISKSGGQITGQGQAVAGLITGAISLVMIPIFAAMLLPALNQAREKARATSCLSYVKAIGFGCAMYADQHDKKLPRNFDDLKEVITSTKLFVCPSAKNQNHYSYEFTGLTNVWGVSSNTVILREIEANHRGKRTLLYDDGHVEQRKD